MKKYLNKDEFNLYEIIWQRAVSSQMSSVIIDQVSVNIISENKIEVTQKMHENLITALFL